MSAIFKKEMSSYFRSSIGWIAIAIATGFSGFVFYDMVRVGSVNMAWEISFLQAVVLFVIPLITMRLFSEEKKNGTDILMYTNPVSLLNIIIGKFLAAMTLLLIMVFSTFIHAIATAVMGGLVDATFVGSLITFFFVSAVFIALGVFVSTATENQIVAAIIGFVVSFIMSGMTGLYVAVAESIEGVTVTILSYFTGFGLSVYAITDIGQKIYDGILWLDPISRMDSINAGILEASPLVYCASLVAFFLFLSYRILEKRRWTQG